MQGYLTQGQSNSFCCSLFLASIRDLTATKICVSGHSRCVWPRYNYTEKLQSQTMLGEHSVRTLFFKLLYFAAVGQLCSY